MLELLRIHAERHSMYRQARMEEEQPRILDKLNELPMVNDAYNHALDIYQRTKGHNLLFRAYFGMAEMTAKAVVCVAAPIISYGFQRHIDRANNFACSTLDSLEETLPIITLPTEEALRQGKEHYERVWPYTEPLMRPVVLPAKLAFRMGKTTFKVGKAAVDVGTTVVSTAMWPVVFSVKASASVTAAVVDTGRQAAGHVASSLMSKGQKTLDAGLETRLGQFWLMQLDVALESTEKLLYHYLPPVEDDQKGEKLELDEVMVPGTRKERVRALANHIHNAISRKVGGDLVRYRMMASNLLQELLDLTGYYMTLLKDGATMMWAERKDILDSVDLMWNKYVQFLPEAVRPTDPLKRMVALLSLMTDKIGELVTSLKVVPAQVGSFLAAIGSAFIAWCKVTSGALKEVRESSRPEDEVSETIRIFVGSVFFGVLYAVVKLLQFFKSQHKPVLPERKEVNDAKQD